MNQYFWDHLGRPWNYSYAPLWPNWWRETPKRIRWVIKNYNPKYKFYYLCRLLNVNWDLRSGVNYE